MNKVLLCAAYSVIEPLGLLHLAGLAKNEGWERSFHLIKDHDFSSLFSKIKVFNPDIIGFNIYTGNHIQTFKAIERIKKESPSTIVVLGGPHATYFPSECEGYADYVVMSEGFRAFRRILCGEVEKGIIPYSISEKFPFPDRELLYTQYPEYGRSKIKSIIGMTGCPYRCTYCYNSSRPEDIKTTPEIIKQIAESLGASGRLFPYNVRDVDEVIEEAQYIKDNYDTDIIYFQDDVHGFDTKKWLPELAEKWVSKVGIPYHAQMRWEMTVGMGGKERLDLVKKAGCDGLTLAIEAADPHVRKEVLDRATAQEKMYEGMNNLVERGFKIRTEQITALPYGATTKPSPVNLDADLGLVELNVNLKKQCGGPTMAWASTFAPYAGTKLGLYSAEHGHYENLDNHDVPDTFFKKSVLRFPTKWHGPELAAWKSDPKVWLDEESLDIYRTQNAALRGYFNLVCLIPQGHILAKRFLTTNTDYSPTQLGKYIVEHLETYPFDVEDKREAINILSNIDGLKKTLVDDSLIDFIPYFGCIPNPELLVQRYLKYLDTQEGDATYILSTATRHHIYDEILYKTETKDKHDDRTI
tara:strand:- start:830 stop:2578 length:1749 start_codon:yes stop_codon:yes gene_type:complete